MSNYIDESTNDVSNPFNPQHSYLKQKLIDQTPLYFHAQDNSQTMAYHKMYLKNDQDTIKPDTLPKKIHVKMELNHEESPDATKTRKFKTNKKLTNEPVQQNLHFSIDAAKKSPINRLSTVFDKKVIPSPSPDVQKILAGPSMREKYGNLLPKSHQKTLSFEQQHLIKILLMMDQTIEFSNQNRSVRFVFFEELRKNIRDSLGVLIEMKHLQQLLYLDESLYEVKWQISYEKKGYDVMITLPKLTSKDQRKNKVRLIIVDFLNQKNKQFMTSKNIQIKQLDGPWHPDFQPSKYEIPRKSIPVHPQTRDAELRSFDQNKIKEIRNQKLKQLIQNKKQQSEVQSFKSKSVMDMIFAGVSSKNIESQIYKAVKERQQIAQRNRIQEEKRIQRQKTEIYPDILKDISSTILYIYVSRNIHSLFKSKLIESVKERTNHRYGNYIVDRHIEFLIELKDIGYLKEINPGKNKPIIVQINRSKSNEVRLYADSLIQKMEQQISTGANADVII